MDMLFKSMYVAVFLFHPLITGTTILFHLGTTGYKIHLRDTGISSHTMISCIFIWMVKYLLYNK